MLIVLNIVVLASDVHADGQPHPALRWSKVQFPGGLLLLEVGWNIKILSRSPWLEWEDCLCLPEDGVVRL